MRLPPVKSWRSLQVKLYGRFGKISSKIVGDSCRRFQVKLCGTMDSKEPRDQKQTLMYVIKILQTGGLTLL